MCSTRWAKNSCGRLPRASRRRITPFCGLSWTDGALALLCEKAKGGKFGARDLRRVIRKEVEDPLSEMLISGKALTSVQVDAQDGAIVLRV